MKIPAQPRNVPARCQRGAAAVELALALTALMLLALATAEYGRAFYVYNTLAKSVRSAARYLAVSTDPDDATTQQQARNLVLYGNVSAGGSAVLLAPELSADMVQISTENGVPTGSGSVKLVTVGISGYAYPAMLGVFTPATLNFGAIRLTMRSRP
jgi:hypothetical protein